MVSQFTSSHQVSLLGEIAYDFPEGIHAIGRLDNRSEGLLILTTNKKVTRLLFQSTVPHKRTYLVQVKGIVSATALNQLTAGVCIRIKGDVLYTTPACEAAMVTHPETIYDTGFHLKEYGPHSWLLVTITEGKFHQVRKMMAAIGHRCTRLLRLSIEDLRLHGLPPGMVQELEEKYFFEKLKIPYS